MVSPAAMVFSVVMVVRPADESAVFALLFIAFEMGFAMLYGKLSETDLDIFLTGGLVLTGSRSGRGSDALCSLCFADPDRRKLLPSFTLSLPGAALDVDWGVALVLSAHGLLSIESITFSSLDLADVLSIIFLAGIEFSTDVQLSATASETSSELLLMETSTESGDLLVGDSGVERRLLLEFTLHVSHDSVLRLTLFNSSIVSVIGS